MAGMICRAAATLTVLLWAACWLASAPQRAEETLTYLAATPIDGTYALYTLDPRRGVTALTLTRPNADIISHAWSPDGEMLAYVLADVSGGRPITLVHGPAHPPQPIPEANGDQSPIWLPDGRVLLHTTRNTELMALSPLTREAETIQVNGLQYLQAATISQMMPGRIVVRGQGVQASNLDYYQVSLANGVSIPVNGLGCADPIPTYLAYSPDGSQLVYRCRGALKLMLAPAGNPENIRPLAPGLPTGNEWNPRWSFDGTRVLFQYAPALVQQGREQYIIADTRAGTTRPVRVPPGATQIEWRPGHTR